METNFNINKDDVIAKIKDDGDFDKLRLKIIRKLKDNEKLREKIISIVKQSKSLNNADDKNLKPRQLSDAIHQEVGNEIMGQISEGLWEVIRSPDGMKNEITETVQSVYDKMMNPKCTEVGESSSPCYTMPVPVETHSNGLHPNSINDNDDTQSLSDDGLNEPPGFTFCVPNQNVCEEQIKEELPHKKRPTKKRKLRLQNSHNALDTDSVQFIVPLGVSSVIEHNQLFDYSVEDPDVPPGFG